MTNRAIHWFYNGLAPRRDYIDPRIQVAKQIGWNKLPGDTPYTVPEPDNYNRAVVTDKPVECLAIEDQVIYKDQSKNAWVTLMYVPDEQLSEYDLWLKLQTVRAHWQHTRAPKLKKQRSYQM